MQTAVLENVFAVVAVEVVVFNYDGITKEYLSQSTVSTGISIQLWRPDPGTGPPGIAGLCGVRADGSLV